MRQRYSVQIFDDVHWKLPGCELATQRIYTVNHKKGGSAFVIITLENLGQFL